MHKLTSILIFVFLLTLTSCASKIGNNTEYNPYSPNIISGAYKIADSLDNIDRKSVLIVASFVDVNNLEKSSPFGRIISEQIASRLCQNGFKVKEINLRKKSIFIDKGKGEFVLSRDIKEVGNEYDVTYFIVGTYTTLDEAVYVSARTINPEDNNMVSSADVYIPINWRNKRQLFSLY